MKMRLLVLVGCVVVMGMCFAPTARAKWIELPMDNPGAEAGHTNGWSRWGMDITPVNDPAGAHAGDRYFSVSPADDYSPWPIAYGYGVSFKPPHDLSSYGKILDLEFSFAYNYKPGKMWAYPADGNDCLLQESIEVGLEIYSSHPDVWADAYFNHANPELLDTDGLWATFTWRFSDYGKHRYSLEMFETAKIYVMSYGVSGFCSDFNFSDYTLGDWVDGPSVIHLDSFRTSIKVVPEPGSAILFLVGAGTLVTRRLQSRKANRAQKRDS